MDSIIRKHKLEKQKKVYFTKETEDAIVSYNLSVDPIFRSNIYQEKIHWAFYKLTENIIHTFKFYHTDVEDLQDLQHEIMTFLLDKIHLFSPERGSKAYSYFGTIVKRYLIIYTQKNYKKQINNLSVDSLSNYSNLDTSDPSFIHSNRLDKEIGVLIEVTEVFSENPVNDRKHEYDDKLSLFIDLYTDYCTRNIYKYFPKEYDAQIADAILELFRKRENIDIFNKKALYIYIREMVDVKTPKITKIANILYDIFKKKYLFYLEYGYFPS
jgi:hypothetical protein